MNGGSAPTHLTRVGLNLVKTQLSAIDGNRPQRREPRALRQATLGSVAIVSELVQRCQNGDPQAFRNLFLESRAQVARTAQRILGQSGELEDVVQEVFVQVHRNIKDFRGSSRFSTWLYRVTVNVVLMHRRAARSRPRLTELPAHLVPHDERPQPEDQVARLARIRAFYRLLDRLSDKKRLVFVLHELEGLAPAEISEIVGAPVLTVRTRLFYARRELASMLRDEPELSLLADELLTAYERNPGARRRAGTDSGRREAR